MEHEQISLEGLLTRLRHMPKTIECGMHSGIPRCCVEFYSTMWLFSSEDSDFRRDHRELIQSSECFADYIPCPTCCKNQYWLQTKPCPDEMNCDHRDEQAK